MQFTPVLSSIRALRFLLVILNCCILTYRHVEGCRILGADTGECQSPSEFGDYMAFCGNVVKYRACVPKAQPLWSNHSTKGKDQFIQEMFKKMVLDRTMLEADQGLRSAGIDEWGQKGNIIPRLTQNNDCEEALRNYFCWLNFPRCDDAGRSLIMCRSVCENYFKACQQQKDLYRCGDPQYGNGYEAEKSTSVINGVYQYYRYPFPGSPFRDNAFDPLSLEALPVCTPSLANSATPVSLALYIVLFATIMGYCISF